MAARFLLEVLTLVALAYWGIAAGGSPVWRAMLGVGAPLAAAVVWARFGSPKAPKRLPPTARIALQTAIFAAGIAAVAVVAGAAWAFALAAAVALNMILMLRWGQ